MWIRHDIVVISPSLRLLSQTNVSTFLENYSNLLVYLLVEFPLYISHSLEINVSRGIYHRRILNLILFAKIL